MARNKYPEQTVQKILEVSLRLFTEQGYDHTTIQDIVNALGLSKGAIYHHFSSKEEILTRLCEERYHDVDWYTDILHNPALNGLQKIKQLLLCQVSDREKQRMDQFSRFLVKNPQMIAHQLHESVCDTAPQIARLIREGNEDGSVHAEYPDEAAQVLILVINLWANPALFPVSKEGFLRKIEVIGSISAQMGLPVFDRELLDACGKYYDAIYGPNDLQQATGLEGSAGTAKR